MIQIDDLPPTATGASWSSVAPNLASKQRLQQALEEGRGNRAGSRLPARHQPDDALRWMKELGIE